MTARGQQDTAAIPKVPDAGAVQQEPDGTRVQIMHNGIKVLADGYYGDWTTRLIALCRGHHEPQEECVFHEVVSRLPVDATMLELGGYWGYYSMWFLRGWPRRRAVIVEPDPAHLAIGEKNAKLNGLAPEFLSGFIGDGPTHSITPFLTEHSGIVSLPRLSVPELMETLGIETLNLLHCDAQGVELEVLESCHELLRRGRVQWIFLSTHAHQISGDPLTHQRCLTVLRNVGAVIESEHDVHESFSGDGLIVARFGPPPAGWISVPVSRNRYSESLFRNPLYDLRTTQRDLEATQRDLEATKRDLEATQRDLEATRQQLEAIRQQLEMIHQSRSWRYTSGLRAISLRLRQSKLSRAICRMPS
jgi:FkbM family methyltransferase